MQRHSPTATAGRTRPEPIQVNYRDLPGKVAVVTGAARGMGSAFAAGLARHGVHVLAADIDQAAVTDTAKRINETGQRGAPAGRVEPAGVDVAVAEQHQGLVTAALAAFGRLDFWVNNAGIFPRAGVLDIDAPQMRSTFGVNVDGVLFGAQAAARHMRDHGGGVIVNMASVAAVRVRPTRGAYAASKAAVDHLSRVLAVELGEYNIRVNAIAPGFIDTEMTRWVHEEPGALDRALSAIPLRRIGAPEEVFGALLFLLSDSARYVTGHTIAVDGGSRHV
jgi:3-oxoacyl-[acyl-carrier protein] reductase